MEKRGTKTIMCSVLFLDIAEYSKKSVSGQIALKEAFNALLAHSISDIPINDRIILDTGDGAAISLLGDVADALKVALNMRISLLEEGMKMDPPLLVRLGINLGPVRLVKDINGQPNIVGDGINVAQRVMGFAQSGQILVSRSYYEAASRMSQEYADMFRFEGSRTDKHVRDHEIYSVILPGEVDETQQKLGDNVVPEIAGEQDAKSGTDGWAQAVRNTFQNASSQQRALYIGAIAGVLVLLIAIVVKVVHRPVAPPQQVVEAADKPVEAQAASDVAAVSPKISEPSAEKKLEAKPVAKPENKPVAKPENKPEVKPEVKPEIKPETKPEAMPVAEKKPKAVHPVEVTPKQVPVGQEKTSSQSSSSTRTLDQTTAVESSASALVGIAVTPWGEVYLDGRMQGVSPPLTELQVTPGKHEIEIRNTTFPAYIQSINVKADEKVKIKHKFTN